MLGPSTSPLGIPRSVIENTLSFSGSDVNFNGKVGIGKTSPTAKLDILDTTLAGSGSLAASALNIAQTWNTTGTPTAIKLNVTDTASNAASLLMDLQVGGNRMFSVSKTGSITFSTGGVGNGLTFVRNSSNNWSMTANAVGTVFQLNGNTLDVPQDIIASRQGIRIRDIGQSTGAWLLGEASHVLAQRNGTNAQTFRIYGTYTSSTNFERLNIQYNGAATAFQIGTEKGSAGGTARALELQTDGVTRLTVTSEGRVKVGTTTSNTGSLIVKSAYGQSAIRVIRSDNDSTVLAAIGQNNSSSFQGLVEVFNSSGSKTINLDGDLASYVSNGSNFGVGTSSPTARLDVNSNIIRLRTAKTPASATDTGNAGDICWDTDYIYVCVATNTWKRSAISTWP